MSQDVASDLLSPESDREEQVVDSAKLETPSRLGERFPNFYRPISRRRYPTPKPEASTWGCLGMIVIYGVVFWLVLYEVTTSVSIPARPQIYGCYDQSCH